jgi:hypothetical protein
MKPRQYIRSNGEFSYPSASMVKAQASTAAKQLCEILEHLRDNDNPPPWVVALIASAAEQISSVNSFIVYHYPKDH